ncbi:putative cobalt-precorrin-6A synthase [Streptomyces sp. NBRC 110611]|nr:cobalt-precorrin-5B (C(1))-methyltransferase [Streptomyces sp. NBRC 110611]GAU66554.1 putative cobalt-precorrin-6A synthase [Streptomyces sp. NBRC 110611]
MAAEQAKGTGQPPEGTGAAAGGRSAQLAHTGLRHGWTTGACATAASTAAYTALLSGEFPDPVTITLPKGQTPSFALAVEEWDAEHGIAMAGVVKDAGDDPDVTHGALIRARVRRLAPGSGVVFKAGPGVGTVTRPGLPLEVGEPAINPVPRQLIREHLARVAERYERYGRHEQYERHRRHEPRERYERHERYGREGAAGAPDVEVEISVDHGEEIARSTWNPRLGILGGLSILGTTGIVVPYSCSAWIDSIRRGVDVARAAGRTHVAGCTGSTSEKVAVALHHLPEDALLDMGDFAGAVLKYLRRHPVDRLTICGGFAKLSKLAAGHLDLHSARSQVDKGFLAELAREGGADEALAGEVAVANTGLAALQLCAAAGVPLGDLVAATARDEALAVLRGAPVAVDVICIDRAGMVVGRAEPRGPGPGAGPRPGPGAGAVTDRGGGPRPGPGAMSR